MALHINHQWKKTGTQKTPDTQKYLAHHKHQDEEKTSTERTKDSESCPSLHGTGNRYWPTVLETTDWPQIRILIGPEKMLGV